MSFSLRIATKKLNNHVCWRFARAMIVRSLLPSMRTCLQTVENMAEINTTQFNSVCNHISPNTPRQPIPETDKFFLAAFSPFNPTISGITQRTRG